MVDATFSFKKELSIIVVTWILSMITTLALVYVVIPNIFPKAWHEVATFSGAFYDRESESTDSFYIPSDNWRLYWNVDCETPPPEDVEFFFILGYPFWLSETWVIPVGQTFELRRVTLEDFRAPQALDFEWLDSESGTEYITGSGEFIIRVIGANIEWEVTVEAYY